MVGRCADEQHLALGLLTKRNLTVAVKLTATDQERALI